MKKILVGLDGSDAARVAASWAAELASSLNAKIVAATAVERRGTRRHDADQTREAVNLLEREWVTQIRETGVDHELRVLEGDPRMELALQAGEGDIDAVVVGTRGTGGFGGLGLGGVANYLAHHLHCPLIVVPRIGGPLIGGTILVGADGSAANEPALQWAAGIGDSLDDRVAALYVHSPLADVMTHTASNWSYPGEDKVRAAALRASPSSAPIEVVLAAGNPVEELVRTGTRLNAAMIVVGRRGWGSVFGLLLGRVPAQLLHHSERPVAVIPH